MSSSLILFNNNEPFLDRIVMCDEKWILYNQWWPAQWLDQEEAPKHFPKPNLHQKTNGLGHWWSPASLIHSSFLNPGKTTISEKCAQQMDETRWKLPCPQSALVSTAGPVLLHDSAQAHQGFRSWKNQAAEFCLVCHSHLTSRQPTTTSSSILTAFCRQNTAIASRRQKMASKSLLNPEAWMFILRE